MASQQAILRRQPRLSALLVLAVTACGDAQPPDPPPKCGDILENVVEASEWVKATTDIRSYRYRASFDAFETEVEIQGENHTPLATMVVRQVYDEDGVTDGTIEALLNEGEPNSLRMTTHGLGLDDLGYEIRARLESPTQSMEIWAELDNEFCFKPQDAVDAPPCANGLAVGDPAYVLPSCGLPYDELVASGVAPTLKTLTYVSSTPTPPPTGQLIQEPDETRYSLTVMDPNGTTLAPDVLAWAESAEVDDIVGSASEVLLTAAYLDRAWWREREKQVAFCIGEEVLGPSDAVLVEGSQQALSGPQSTDAQIVDWVNGTDRSSSKRKNVAGDPHLVSFDGKKWDFQAYGEFILAEGTDDDFLVQLRTEGLLGATLPACMRVTVATAVATEIDGMRIAIYGRPRFRLEVDGVVVDAPSDLPRLPSGTSLRLGGNRVTIEFPTGEVLAVSAGGGAVSFQLPPSRRGKIRGLLGNFDGDDANDLALRDGTTLAAPVPFPVKHGVLADSWRIAQADSLFDYAPGEDTNTFTRFDFPTSPARIEDLPPADVAEADRICREEGVTDPSSLSDCILDIACTQDRGLADEHSKQPAGSSIEPPNGDLVLQGAIAMGILPAVIRSEPERMPGVCEGPSVPVVSVFEERSSETLQSALTPELAPEPEPIPAGTVVRSYLLHRNPGEEGFGPLRANIKFGGRILGLFVTSEGLDATDAALGAPEVEYVSEPDRGLEEDDGLIASWSGQSLSIEWDGPSDADQVRVLTEVTP